MSLGEGHEVTDLLVAWEEGDSEVQSELWTLVYDELRRVASQMMNGECANHTLQPTALVNEAFLKLANNPRLRFKDRRHFFAVAARMMRRVLVDHARTKHAAKRDGGERVELDMTIFAARMPGTDVVELDDALVRLEALEPEKARVVEFRFFGGLTNDEMATVMGCSERTVRRHWKVAKLWLHRELVGGDSGGA